jgi:hypothetical protein
LDDRKGRNPNTLRWKIHTGSVAELNQAVKHQLGMQAMLGSKQAFRKIDNTMRIGWKGDTLFLPHWLLVLLTGASSVFVGMRRPYRFNFSLRTLLIATTLVAVILGLVVYAAS